MECSVYKIPNWKNLTEEDGKGLCLLTYAGIHSSAWGGIIFFAQSKLGQMMRRIGSQYYNDNSYHLLSIVSSILWVLIELLNPHYTMW